MIEPGYTILNNHHFASFSLADSNEAEAVGSYFDLIAGRAGILSIVFGDGQGYANYMFTAAGALTEIYKSVNVFTTLQTGTDHVIIKDNGTNVRIVNEMGAAVIFTLEIHYTL